MRKAVLIPIVIGLVVFLVFLQNLFKPVTVEKRMFPFYLPWDDCEQTATSMGGRLHKPAGSLGYVYAGEDGHLYVNGERIKFLGVNICGGACFPDKAEAEKIAGRLAKFGVNVVRFHHMDASWEAFNIFDKTTGGTRRLSKDALDRLDYFISKLKENGIYVDLNLLVSRRLTSADGLPREVESVDWKDQQILGFFTDEAEELEKEYARQLLTRLNPYTGRTYAEDPAVAFVEIVNEQGLMHSWLGGVVDRLPQVFKNKLQEKWNFYLRSKYGSDEEFRKAWSIETSPGAQAEVLRNGCFEHGLEGWVVEVHDGAQASGTVVEEPGGRMVLEIRVTRLGSEGWHVQFNQPGLRVREGENYLVRFKAKADKTVSVSVGLVQAHEPWRWVSPRVELSLTTEWREYEIALVASESEDNARLDVSGLGRNIATYRFSCFSMRPFSGYGPMEDESIEKTTVRVLTLAEYGLRAPPVKRDWIEFLYGMEEEFFTGMRSFIKYELGVKALVIGTIVGCSTPNIMSKLDVVDTHAYWNHPSFPGTPWDPSNWYVVNEPMVNNPHRSTIVGLAVKRVWNKPHFVTEYNHPAPNMYDSETVVTLAAYAALQDWDGVFLFDYGSRDDWDSKRIRGFFDIDQHPVKMATLVAAHMIFLRGDVRPADHVASVVLNKQDEISLIMSGKVYAWALPDASHMGLNPLISLIHRVAIKPEGEFDETDLSTLGPVYKSDTGEVIWDASNPEKGVITINTSRSIAVVGFSGGRSFDFEALVIEPGETLLDGWSVMTVSVLEGESFKSWNRLLLVAAGYVTNTRMSLRTYHRNLAMLAWRLNDLVEAKTFMEPITCGANWGSAPTLVEGVEATLRIKTDKEVEVWVLDGTGNRVKQVQVSNKGEYKVFSIGQDFKTIWYEIALSGAS